MIWLKVFQGVLGLARALTDFLGQRQLLNAGEARRVASDLTVALGMVARAQRARRNAVELPDDPLKRD